MTPERFKHYMVNIPVIDNEHYSLLREINAVTALFKDKNFNEAKVELETLKINMREHTKREEDMFKRINFKFANPHVDDHVRLTKNLDKIILMSDNDLHRNLSHIVAELEDIFITHIDHYDMQYADAYKEATSKNAECISF